MRITSRQTSTRTRTRTLADLIRSMDRRQAVTITYAPAGEEETVRTIEVHDIRTTEDGHIVVIAMCRLRGAERQFRIDDIAAYTLHRKAFAL
ncbi:WYL domain-containing protein [Streptomyces sp. NBC_00510]